MSRTATLVIALCAAAVCAWYRPWLPPLLLPVFVWFVISAGKKRVDSAGVEKLKSTPSETRAKEIEWLDGAWELAAAGCRRVMVKVPSDLATVRGAAGGGPFRYTRRVEKLPEGGRRLFLCGRGIGGKACVYVNRRKTGGVIPGFAPFEIDLTDSVGAAPFDLRIDVYPELGPGAPGRMEGLAPPYGTGVIRELYLESRPELFIRNAVLIQGGNGALLSVDIEGMTDQPAAVSVEISGAKDREKVFQEEKIIKSIEGKASIQFDMSSGTIEPWTAENPATYSVVVKTVSGSHSAGREFVTGLCVPDFSSGEPKINGEPVLFRGIIRCEHYPPYGAAIPKWAAAKDVQAIRESALNIVYCADYPPHDDFLEACDRLGLYVISEYPARHVAAAGQAESATVIRRDAERMERHPCFLAWVVPGDDGKFMEDAGVPADRVLYSKRGSTGEKGNFKVVKMNVDMYGEAGYYEMLVEEFGRDGMLVIDYVDTEAGAESRNKRELRKAAKDVGNLKAADEGGVRALVLGQLFTWGLRSGIRSINRQKKASSEVIRDYLDTRKDSGITWSKMQRRLPMRTAGLAFAAVPVALMLIPGWARYVLTAREHLTCFQPYWHPVAIQGMILLAVAQCLSGYFDWNRQALTGAAPYLGYPAFMRLFVSNPARAALGLVSWAYLSFLGIFAMVAVSGQGLEAAAAPAMTASLFELVFVTCIFLPVRPVVLFASAALMEWAYVMGIAGPGAAAVFVAVKFLPAIALFLWLDIKCIFKE